MGKLLSHAERDALLSHVTQRPSDPGGLTEHLPAGAPRRAVPYDFKHPNRVSTEELRKLEGLHDAFAGGLSGFLSALWRTVVDTDLVSVEQITYTEFVSSIRSPSCTYTFTLGPLAGSCLLDFDPALAFALVERLLGGRGSAVEAGRRLTRIERSLMQPLACRFLAQLETCWKRVLDVRAQSLHFESDPHLMQMVPPGETVIVATLQLNMPASGGLVSLMYPCGTLEPILGKLAAGDWHHRPAVELPVGHRLDVARMLTDLEVTVTALLGDVQLPLSELLAMEPDRVMPLPVRKGDLVTIQVEGRSKYLATLGRAGRHTAIRIEHSYTKEA